MAYEAAVAAKCAALQGTYSPFQAELFNLGNGVKEVNWLRIANHARIPNSEELMKCIKNKATAHLVDEDLAVAQKLGIDSTPVMVINGDIVSGAKSERALEELLSIALSEM